MPRQYRERTTVTKDGQVIKEQIPLEAIVPPADDEAEAKPEEGEDEELSPQEEAYYEVTQDLVRQDLKLSVSRINESGGEKFVGRISPEEARSRGLNAAIQSRFGGGVYKIDFVDLSTGRPISTTVEVDGEPKILPDQPGITLNMPKQQGSEIAPLISLMSSQLSKQQDLTNALIMKLAENKTQPASVAGMSLEQLAVMKEIFTPKKDDSGEKLKEWLGLIRTLIDNVAPMMAPQSDNPWVAFAQQILPNVKETISSLMSKPSSPAGVTRIPVPQVASPQAQAQAPATSQDIQVIKNLFEGMYLKPLVDAAAKDLDPYALTFNFKAQLGGDTLQFLPSLGLANVAAFYEAYPVAKQYEEWFNEFFYWMANPGLEPMAEEDVPEEGVIEAEQASAAPVPKNGSGGDAEPVMEKKRPGRTKKQPVGAIPETTVTVEGAK